MKNAFSKEEAMETISRQREKAIHTEKILDLAGKEKTQQLTGNEKVIIKSL